MSEEENFLSTLNPGVEPRYLRDLAAGFTTEATLRFCQTEYGWRLSALRAIFVRAEALDLSPLPSIEDPWELLTQVQRAAPRTIEAVLGYPPVGTWATRVLRRLRGDTDDAFISMWAEIGYLHTLAASGAILAGIDFQMVVPAVAGVVTLPMVGHTYFTPKRRSETAEVVRSNGTIRVTFSDSVIHVSDPLVDGYRWRASRSVHVIDREIAFDIAVEDVDPYRMVQDRMPPARLTNIDFEQWRDVLSASLRLLVDIDPTLAASVGRTLKAITPLPAAARFRARSASSAHAFGLLQASTPDSVAQMAAVLVHEFHHAMLDALIHLIELHNVCDDLFYAPWRDDPRPLAGLLHGIYAFVGVTWFWRVYRWRASGNEAALAHFEFALGREQTAQAIESLARHEAVTDAGHEVLAALLRRLSVWLTELVPEPARTFAADAVADHRASWRVHHLRPPDVLVESLSAAWLAGQSAEVGASLDRMPAVVPFAGSASLDGRAVLARYHLMDPTAFESLLAKPESVGDTVMGTTSADLHLVFGDQATAHRMYLNELASDPKRRHAWVGLGLALTDPAASQARAALLGQPELVRAVAQRLTRICRAPVDVVALATWIFSGIMPDV